MSAGETSLKMRQVFMAGPDDGRGDPAGTVESNQLTARQPSAAIFGVRMVTSRAPLIANPQGTPARATGW
jgi:hypothetical protein